jgi:hypothetical protein
MVSLRLSHSAFLLCAALAACADITPPLRFTTVDYVMAESSGALSGFASFVTPLSPAAPGPPFSSTCPYDATSKMFECELVTSQGRTYSLSFQLLDAAGQPLASWDSTLVDGVRTVKASDGPYLLYDPLSVRSDRTIHGLLDGNRIVDGRDSTMAVTKIMDVSTTVTDVIEFSGFRPRVRNLPGSVPTGGTITFRKPFGETSVLTFNGTANVQWVKTASGVTNTCNWIYGTPNPKCP